MLEEEKRKKIKLKSKMSIRLLSGKGKEVNGMCFSFNVKYF